MLMKKIFYFLVLSVMSVAASSCADIAKEKLKAEFEAVNDKCPVDLGSLGEMTSARYDAESNAGVFLYTLNEEYVDVASLRKAVGAQKVFMSEFLKSESSRSILKSLVDADASLEMRFTGADSQEESTITFTAAELKELDKADASEDNAMRQLEAMVSINNAQCPKDMGDGLVSTECVIEGKYTVYRFDYDVDQLPMDTSMLPEFEKALRESLSEELNYAGNKHEKELMIELGMGVKYVYNPVNGMGDVLVVEITPEEVAAM